MRKLLGIALLAGVCSFSCGGARPPVARVGAGTGTPGMSGDITLPTPDPRALMVADLAALRFHRLGNPVLRWDHIPQALSTRERPHKLLVVLAEFPDHKFDRFKGDKQQASKLAAYYQEQLFDDDYARVNTLSHYYATQSLGRYHITGSVLPPVALPQPRAHYGTPVRPAGGAWRNDGNTEGMVEDALRLAVAAHADFPWSDYDRWDPTDFDDDGNIDEPDGYIDHFVLVFAGGGQSSCQLLNKIEDALTPNVGPEALAQLDKRQRECAERLWPHRFQVQRREGQGPRVGDATNARGGAPLTEALWAFDYNMQSEYTEASTFIHEFGHSIGLPDVYSRASDNSTGGWEVMSSTADPSPQNLSAWSRLMLGWLKPQVVLPPEFGGPAAASALLRTLDDPAGDEDTAARAVMVVLPPKQRTIELTTLPPASGAYALYSGQGNDMNRTAELTVDLSKAGEAIELSFDAWWDIEGGWDFAYVETATEDGAWTRRVPADRRYMPAKHGHDGESSLPGFTGLSGDLDGDGKNESHTPCDPAATLDHGEDAAGKDKSPCLVATWVRVAFDLSDLRGQRVRVRLRYFTDTAAVQPGILIDNVTVTDAAVSGTFEQSMGGGWRLDGFSRSPGRHEVLVPHYYLIEYRDPYANAADGDYRYDTALADPSYRAYWNPTTKKMMAVQIKTRPGVVVWYADGEFAWSENDPAVNGPGKGYLLAIDANPSELALPGLEAYFVGTEEARDSHYDVSSEAAQAVLRDAYYQTTCFVRNPSYLPKGGVPTDAPKGCGKGKAPLEAIKLDGKKLMYTYQITNDFLPGAAREGLQKVSELFDEKTAKGVKSFRMRDRSLRYVHTQDGSFSLEPLERAVVFYEVTKRGLVEVAARAFAAAPRFSDLDPRAWLNPKLPFGGVAVPGTGFGFELAPVSEGAPAAARVKLDMTWQTEPPATAPAPPSGD